MSLLSTPTGPVAFPDREGGWVRGWVGGWVGEWVDGWTGESVDRGLDELRIAPSQ